MIQTRQWVMAAILTFCGATVFTACVDSGVRDNPTYPVNPKEEIAQETFIHENWMDRNVNPGDSFYQFAIGSWMKNHDKTDKGTIYNALDKQTQELKDGLASYATPNHAMQLILGPLASEQEQEAVMKGVVAQLKDGDNLTKADVMRNIGKIADMGFSALMAHDVFGIDRTFRYYIEPGDVGSIYIQMITDRTVIPGMVERVLSTQLGIDTEAPGMSQRIQDVGNIECWILDFKSKWTSSYPTPAFYGQGRPMLKSDPVPALTALSTTPMRRTAENDELMAAFREAFHIDSHTYFLPEVNQVLALFDQYDAQTLQLYLKYYLGAKLSYYIYNPANPVNTPETIFQVLNKDCPGMFLDYHKAMLLKDSDCEGALKLLEELRGLFAQRIRDLDWLSEATKEKALEKLQAMLFNVGGPKELFNADFVLTGKSPIEELLQYKAQADNYLRNELAGKPTVGDYEWYFLVLSPMGSGIDNVNAFYDHSTNQLVILPAFLRGELFPADKNDIMRYVTLQVFGHEMTHGFDGNGAQYDAKGNKVNWWTAEDKAKFEQRQQVIVDRYNELEQYPGVKANGEKTKNENIADLGGMNLAWEMWNRKLQADGLTSEALRHQQRQFLVENAHLWQSDESEATLKQRLEIDVHSPFHNRVNGVLRLFDDWYTLFGVESGDKLYVKPEDRVKIW